MAVTGIQSNKFLTANATRSSKTKRKRLTFSCTATIGTSIFKTQVNGPLIVAVVAIVLPRNQLITSEWGNQYTLLSISKDVLPVLDPYHLLQKWLESNQVKLPSIQFIYLIQIKEITVCDSKSEAVVESNYKYLLGSWRRH